MKIYCKTEGNERGRLWQRFIMDEVPNDYIEWVNSPGEADFVFVHAQGELFYHCDWVANPNYVAWLPFDNPFPDYIAKRVGDDWAAKLSIAAFQRKVGPNAIGINSFPWVDSFLQFKQYGKYRKFRCFDLMCVHYATYSNPKVVAHRDLATQAAMNLPATIHRLVGASKDREGRMSKTSFVDLTSRSKVAICADGFGPISCRDFEAVALGCVLIKPETIHNSHDRRCYTWPDPVDIGQVVFCKSDYSDLSEKVDEALALFDKTEAERAAASETLVKLESIEFFQRLHSCLKGFSTL
jgi:hypothetical protein